MKKIRTIIIQIGKKLLGFRNLQEKLEKNPCYYSYNKISEKKYWKISAKDCCLSSKMNNYNLTEI